MRRRVFRQCRPKNHLEDGVAIWLLRLVLHASPLDLFFDDERELDTMLFRVVGIGDRGSVKLADAERILRQKLGQLERGRPPECAPLRNARIVGSLVGLNRAEVKVLGFCIAYQNEYLLRHFADQLTFSKHDWYRVLARILKLQPDEVRRALRRDGTLRTVPVLEPSDKGLDDDIPF